MTARILIYDIERFPFLGWYWDRWVDVIPMDMTREPGRMSAFGAKWLGSKTTMCFTEYHDDGHENMTRKAWDLFDEADVVVGFNSKKFDRRHVRTEFEKYHLPPHSPVREIDLYQVVRSQLNLPSNRLVDVAEFFGLPQQKMKHEGFRLWRKCMEGDPKAWDKFRRYCKQDVRTHEALYQRVLHLIPAHPHLGLYVDDDAPVCGQCGSDALQRRGHATTQLGRYARFQCTSCGKWSRGKKAEKYAEERPI